MKNLIVAIIFAVTMGLAHASPTTTLKPSIQGMLGLEETGAHVGDGDHNGMKGSDSGYSGDIGLIFLNKSDIRTVIQLDGYGHSKHGQVQVLGTYNQGNYKEVEEDNGHSSRVSYDHGRGHENAGREGGYVNSGYGNDGYGHANIGHILGIFNQSGKTYSQGYYNQNHRGHVSQSHGGYGQGGSGQSGYDYEYENSGYGQGKNDHTSQDHVGNISGTYNLPSDGKGIYNQGSIHRSRVFHSHGSYGKSRFMHNGFDAVYGDGRYRTGVSGFSSHHHVGDVPGTIKARTTEKGIYKKVFYNRGHQVSWQWQI